MKKKLDPRHLNRIKIIQQLFSLSFDDDIRCVGYRRRFKNESFEKIVQNSDAIDKIISTSAPQFPLEKIAKIDVAILRLAIYELLFEKAQPVKVIIDEAVELGKAFGGDGSPSFINGVLGTIYNINKHE
ncbi:transcription antitermination factor NusB [Candidatus Gottesmanbacteria bacterium CG11_big_fil_rev_8_21_14_0_20_37_11]|uniref:Transcription antitermination protein NusB n=3 Tax=Candidatus Gottesmaniibacteriota TaxID=1752720 RepID=A0A2M7RPS8_9BACT|nr:MAG: transcription antitermination factor NusB [Candidatus Gottesmanbacteria bacterium CG1_02_37_22]PIP32257.1 MAG: transcription antitermination factor NusB [Candidatus Gottesmanbacteria bacterium CG23_combo_of_CG06-09_8_20_14_all_37_19]PIR08363.1 MAG: transcription antitermination factor NusB [Candidatus Gottesmanbacteria bacterium CG11_big_fil_rev_8_21_14_0_20_37_11]PIZ02323.1 MAG: transcription antitermination factor NusB [Candidatus Gottesmanbacteria bacterium CG_4_10_14_0_8_um_filter_37